jgi:hypothetical protein
MIYQLRTKELAKAGSRNLGHRFGKLGTKHTACLAREKCGVGGRGCYCACGCLLHAEMNRKNPVIPDLGETHEGRIDYALHPSPDFPGAPR